LFSTFSVVLKRKRELNVVTGEQFKDISHVLTEINEQLKLITESLGLENTSISCCPCPLTYLTLIHFLPILSSFGLCKNM